MKSKRNLALVVMCMIVCLCAVLNKGLMGARVIPQRHKSNLEGRMYERRPQVSLSTLADGSFQDSFERYVADSVPFRDGIVLANAAAQRTSIALANSLFGYVAYPTFYGSSYVYVPMYDAIMPIALKDADQDPVYAKTRSTLVSFAERHPDLQIFVLEIDSPKYSSANPTQSLVSDAANTDDARRAMLEELPCNAVAVGHDNMDLASLTSAYYRTDHHWKTDEAYRSYEEALHKMLPGTQPVDVLESREFKCGFLGSTMRLGLMLPKEFDSILDYKIDMSSYIIKIDGEEVDPSAVDSWVRYEDTHFEGIHLWPSYADYYHSDYGFLEIHNQNARTEDSLLIVADSYTNCMERFFAGSYAHVYKIDARHTSLLADDFLRHHPEVRQVLIVGQTVPILAGALSVSK